MSNYGTRKKLFYPWWRYIKDITQKYPCNIDNLSGAALRDYEALCAAIETTKQMADGQSRLKVIKLLYWDKTHTLDGAALAVNCSRRTAASWQRQFFEEVARNRGLLD